MVKFHVQSLDEAREDKVRKHRERLQQSLQQAVAATSPDYDYYDEVMDDDDDDDDNDDG